MIQKNIRLAREFDRYVSRNPSALNRLSDGARVIFTSASDTKLSEANRDIARNSRSGKFVEAHKSAGKWSIRTFKK